MFWLRWHRLSWTTNVFPKNRLSLHYLFRNPDTVTIEGTLENAIVKAGGISAANAGNLQKVGWGRCARTDKGVHAAAQMFVLLSIIELVFTVAAFRSEFHARKG